jgi:hypothetical protein
MILSFTASFTVPRSLLAQTPLEPPPLLQLIHTFDEERPTATAYALWNVGQGERHEVWFRIIGGDADYQQRLRVYKEQAAPRPNDTLPPTSTVVYESDNNVPSAWTSLGRESVFFTYYFEGDNRPNSNLGWANAKAVRVKKMVYSNGDLYIIRFEDINELDDYNDLEVEVLLIHS